MLARRRSIGVSSWRNPATGGGGRRASRVKPWACRQDPRAHAGGVAHQREQDVLGADVALLLLKRLAQRQFKDLLRPLGERDVPGGRLVARPGKLLDLRPGRFHRDPRGPQDIRRRAALLVQQPEQQVLAADVVVAEHPGLFLGQHHRAP
jgi:hypothetical protein